MDIDTDFTYTAGMTESEVEAALGERGHGVLALAVDGESYAVPVFHHYENGSLLFRLGESPDSRKQEFIESTETATYVVYEVDATADAAAHAGWSVVARGPIHAVPEDAAGYDAAAINERFAPIRLFDEAPDEVALTLYELRVDELAGRRNDRSY